MKKTLAVIIAIFFIFYFYPHEKDEAETIKNILYKNFIKDQIKKNNFQVFETGNGASKSKGKFDLLIIGFETKENLTVDSGRKLIINISKDFLKIINNNNRFQNFLFPSPFCFEGLEISLRVTDPITRYKFFSEGINNKNEVSYINLYKGIINYYIYIGIQNRKKVHEETFEQALAILEKEK